MAEPSRDDHTPLPSVDAGAAAKMGLPAAVPQRLAPGVLLGRLSGHLNTLLASGAVRVAHDGVIDVVVNEQEVSKGGMVKIAMHVPVRCPACAGVTGRSCDRCGGKGVLDELYSAWLALRPGVPDGASLIPSALLPGMVRSVSFRVRYGTPVRLR